MAGGRDVDTLIAFVKDLLAADFPKVAGLFGLAFLCLGIVDSRIVLGPVTIPRRDRLGRMASLVLGVLFACVPLIQLSWGSVVALWSAPATNSITIEPGRTSGNFHFIAPANAAERRYKITAGQRSLLDASQIFGGRKVSLYVGDVHLKRPITIVFFKTAARGAATIQAGANLAEADIRAALAPADIVFLASLTQGDTRPFSADGRQYSLTVDSVIWSILGADSVTLSVKTDVP